MKPSAAVRASALGALALLLLAGPASTQNPMVDQGTLLLSRDGRPLGTEQFIIRRSGSGPDARIVATADIRVQPEADLRHVSPALEMWARNLDVRAYQVKISGDQATEIFMTLNGGRFQAKVVTERGEEVREYRTQAGAVVLDEGVVHHYHFLVARALNGTTTVPALVPRTGRQIRVRVSDQGRERIVVAGQSVQARHLQVVDGDATRDVWVDESGRLLRVVDPGSGLRAERKDLPG